MSRCSSVSRQDGCALSIVTLPSIDLVVAYFIFIGLANVQYVACATFAQVGLAAERHTMCTYVCATFDIHFISGMRIFIDRLPILLQKRSLIAAKRTRRKESAAESARGVKFLGHAVYGR